MAENTQPRGFDVNQPGSGRETGIGLLRGMTTDLVGGVVDFFPFMQYSVAPTVALTMPDAADKVVEKYGSRALEEKFFGLAPTEELQTIRDDAALFSSALGLTEIATAKAANFLGRQISDVFKRADGATVAVTPDGQEIPIPPNVVSDPPDTSVTEMLASADTPGINPKFAAGLKDAEQKAQARLEAGEDPEVVFAETGFMRMNVDARTGRGPDDPPLETKMVFDIPDNLSQINFTAALPKNIQDLAAQNASAKDIMDAFEQGAPPNMRPYSADFNPDTGTFSYAFGEGQSAYKRGAHGRTAELRLDQVMSPDHPLFEIFPDLKDEIKVVIMENPQKGSGGHWDKTNNTIAIGAQYLGNERYTSTLVIHELAHVLQTRGDLPGGSSPFVAPKSIMEDAGENFALMQSVEFLMEKQGPNGLNVFEFLDGYGPPRPKMEKDALIKLIDAARFNVQNFYPGAPPNMARMWPGNLYSTANQDLDNMPYADEVKAEILRILAEREARVDKQAQTYEALGIEVGRQTDETGSLLYGPNAQSNYMRTRGEFYARLQEAYAMATEGMSPEQRRKLFPMNIAKNPNLGTTGRDPIPPSASAPGTSIRDVGEFYRVIADGENMPNTGVINRSQSVSKYPSEAGLVDINALNIGDARKGGLINMDKLPPEIKNRLEYPARGKTSAPLPPEVTLRDPNQPPFTVSGEAFPKYDFTNSAPADSSEMGGFMSAVDMIHKPTGTRIPADSMIRGHKPDFEKAPGIPDLDEETARRIMMGEITVEEARKELVRKNLKVVDPSDEGIMSGPAPKIPNSGIGPFANKIARRPIKTYHGSGTDFDEFSMSAVGTGEGAQMYGHGLYLSDLEDVGRSYRDQVGSPVEMVADAQVAVEERAGGFNSMGIMNENADAAEALIEMQPEIVEIDGVKHFFIKDTEENANENFLFTELPDVVGVDNVYSNLSEGTFRYMYPDGTSVMTRSKNAEGVEYEHPETGEFGVIVEFLGPAQGKVMKVEMDIDPKTEMLDYHETFDRMDRNVQQKVLYAVNYLLEQKPANDSGLRRIKKDLELVINKGKMSQNDGQGLLYALAHALDTHKEDPAISELLSRFGIRGTRYYTAGSRGRSLEPYERTYNYVVFDDSALKITEKYRKGGAVTADHGIAGFIPYMVQ